MDKNARTFAIIVLCGIIGLIFAILLQLLYEADVIVPTFVSSGAFTLAEIQLGIIIVWEIIGIVIAAVES